MSSIRKALKVDEIREEALDRAIHGQSLTNYPTIFDGFIAKGIPEADIRPRENVFTFNAWRAQGRCVRKGEHGVKILTFIEATSKREPTDRDSEPRTYRPPWTTTVFHISQTDPE